MLRKVARSVPILLAALLAAPGGAVPPKPTPEQKTDGRLAQTVTLNVLGTDLGRLAKQITLQTGVGVRVEKDIADEKLDVFVARYPLGRLQRHISALFGYRWSIAKGTEDEPVYVLYRDENTRKRQESLRALKKERTEARLKEDVGNIQRLLDMKEEDLEKLPLEERRFAEYVRVNPVYRFLLGLDGSDRDALYGNGFRTGISALQADSPLLEDMLTDPVSRVRQSPDQFSDISVELPGHGGQTGYRSGQNAVVVSLMRNGHPVGARFYPLTKEDFRHVPERPDPELQKATLQDFRPSGEAPDLSDPRLAKPLADKDAPREDKGRPASSADFHAGCRWIAASTGVPILSDYYTPPRSDVLLVAGLKAKDALERLSTRFRHTWVVSEGALLFRENDWPNLMPREVPLSTLEALEKAGGSRKGDQTLLNLDQSLLAAGLSDEQLEHLPAYGWRVAWAGSEQTKAILRFVAALTPEQRARLEGAKGFDLSALPSGLGDLFARFYDERWTRNGYAPVVFSARLERNVQLPDSALTYARITYQVSLDGEDRELQSLLPVTPDRGPETKPEGAAREKSAR